eukprot:4864014-Pyramimonas_sp.AAC.2
MDCRALASTSSSFLCARSVLSKVTQRPRRKQCAAVASSKRPGDATNKGDPEKPKQQSNQTGPKRKWFRLSVRGEEVATYSIP